MSVILDVIREQKNSVGMRNMMYHESIAKIGNKYHVIVKMLSPYKHHEAVARVLADCKEKESKTRGWIRTPGNVPGNYDPFLLKKLSEEVHIDSGIAKQVIASVKSPGALNQSKEAAINKAAETSQEKSAEILAAGEPKKRGRKKIVRDEDK